MIIVKKQALDTNFIFLLPFKFSVKDLYVLVFA